MKSLQIAGFIIIIIGLMFMFLWRYILVEPSDWLLRFSGIFVLLAIFTLVFSSVRLHKNK